jgi:membrane protease subunit (stomatin/prohibitin family)
VTPLFDGFGLALDSVTVQNISLPEALQKALDARISMGVIGDMGRYTQYQAATSIPVAAQNESGLAGAGVGLGAGLGLGQTLSQALNQAQATPQAAAAVSGDEVMATLEKLHGLMTKGILSKEEFETKKAELLKKLTL